jgi:hypothetical protein
MDKQHLYDIKCLINEYGARATLQGFAQALKECADEYSDMGLKERAHEAVEVAELLAGVHTVTEA